MHSSLALSLLAFAGLSAAQATYQIDPTTVPKSTRDYWCSMEISQCPLICRQLPGVTTQNTISNDCDAENLTYNCVCENGVSPNVTQYTQTLPYFVCTEWGSQCVAACRGDNTCANACRADHPCGAQEPAMGNATLSTSSSMMASATASQTGNSQPVAPVSGFAGVTATSTPGAAPATVNLGSSYGLAITLAGFFAGFALL